ncbi:terpenoid synthase [Marasmius fiardii PR-910]|nr:terpenoid synthase [Marasmius fiardii PR-910]
MTVSSQPENKTMSLSTKSRIKNTVHELLMSCSIPFDKNFPVDQDLYDECKELLESKFNFPSSLYPWFGTCLYIGVDLACSAFSHLPKRNQVHVAFFTATHMALDDHFQKIYEQMEGFSERLVKGLPQDNPILDATAKVLFDMPQYYGRLQSNLIVTSTLDFISSLMMDMEIQKMASLDSPDFAAYCRLLSGISVAFAMFIFPKEIEVAGYIQCLPHLNTYINGLNDVLSFYKEELAQDDENFVTMLAREAGITKYEALKRRADEVVEADRNILKGLAGNQPALDCWLNFRKNFVHFHISSSRYKLNELFDFTEIRKSR